MLKLNNISFHRYLFDNKLIIYVFVTLLAIFIIKLDYAYSKMNKQKVSINGSGLEIPRMVSLKNSLTYMRSGPGKEFPVKYELKQKGYPLKIIAEYNNWRKVKTMNNISGWIHTQLLSSFRTGLITETTFLKTIPFNSGKFLAKLLPNLLINIKKCKNKWCKVEIVKRKVFVGWVKKRNIWGSTKN